MRLQLQHSTPVSASALRPDVSDGVAHLRYWRPVPHELADIVCGEGTVGELPLHTHDALRVMLPASRFAVVDGRRRATVVAPGLAHVATPLTLHAARRIGDAPCSMRVILISSAMLAQLDGGQLRDALPRTFATRESGERCRVVADAALYAELWALFDEMRRPLVDASCASRLLRCVARLLAPRNEPPALSFARSAHATGTRAAHAARRMAGIDRVCDHLRERVAEHVSLDELAQVARLSKFYLLRVFRATYGLTPHAYQMQLRLARAWRLIAEGRPLSHTTYDAGFADQSHLTRRFAATFGVTPARYARQLAVTPGADPVGARAAAPSAA
jgi:AraC-like DNA-binding protein